MKSRALLFLLLAVTGRPILAQVDNSNIVGALSDSATTLEKKHEFSGAIRVYRELIGEYSNSIGLRLRLARVLSWNGDFDSSLVVYHDILSEDPNSFEAMFGVATVTSWKHDYLGSLKLFKQLLTRYPDNVDVMVSISRVSFWDGESDSAISYSKRALALDPKQEDALLIVSQASAEKLDFESARSYLLRLMKADPDNEAGRNLLQSIRDEYLNKVTASYSGEEFGPANRYSNGTLSLRYDKTVSYSVQLFGEVDSRNTFGSKDIAGMVGGSYRFSDVFSADGDFLYGPKTSTAQREKGTIEANYSFLGSLTATGTYQYLQFLGTAVNVLSPSMSYYFTPEDWLTLSVYFGKNNSGGSSTSFLCRTDFSISDGLEMQLGAFHGTELYLLVSQFVLAESATGGFLSAKYKLASHYALQADLNYTKWTSSPWDWSYSEGLTLQYSW